MMKVYGYCRGYSYFSIICGKPLHELKQYFSDEVKLTERKSLWFVVKYIRYSEEFVQSRNDSYAKSYADIADIPAPHNQPYYPIPQFINLQDEIPFNPFKYNPDVILKYYYELDKDDDHTAIPVEYYNFYKMYRQKYDAYNYQKTVYKKHSKVFNLYLCTEALEFTNKIVDEIKALVVDFSAKIESLHRTNLYLSFIPRQINNHITTTLMKMNA